MPDKITSATVNRAVEHSPTAGETTADQPTNRDYAGKLPVVMNCALVGVPSAYAVSNSLAVTAMAAALAAAAAAALLAAQRMQRRRPR